MKIAIISTGHIPSYWAHSINVMKHANAFYKLNHEVEIITVQRLLEMKFRSKIGNIHDFYGINKSLKILFFNDSFPFFLKETKLMKYILDLISNLIPYSRPLHIPVQDSKNIKNLPPVSIKTSNIIKNFIKFIPKFYLKLRKINDPERKISEYCVQKEIDLAYCRTYNAAYYNILNKIPSIMEYHLPNFNNPDFQNLLKLSRNKFFKGIITIHEILKEELINKGVPPNKILILEDAVDLENFDSLSEPKEKIRETLNFPKEKKIILYAGSLKEGRGIDTIIIAAGILNKEDFSFYIIGGNKNEIIKWKSFLKKKHVKADISFLGFKEHKLIPLYLKSADILLAPYTLRCETVRWMSPIKIFEYMASKIPIIASDVKRIKEICKNNECLLFKTDNPIDLSEKIQILTNDKNLESNLIQNAYNKAKTYTYKNRCKIILEKFAD